MKVQLGSKTFVISWHHHRENEFERATECVISEVTPDNKLNEITKGTAVCSFLDNYDKNVGRKLSLSRALLTKAPDQLRPQNDWINLFSKEDRVHVWKEYYQQRGNQW